MKITGERYISDDLWGTKSECEHRHRYNIACDLAEGKIVLDVASGSGYGSHMLAQRAKFVYGIDVSQEAIDYGKHIYIRENLFYQVMDGTQLDFLDETFDLIVSFETLEHLSEKEQIRFLKELCRVLKKDGLLIISSPDKDILRNIVNKGTINPYHVHEVTEREFSKLLSQEFANVKLFYQNLLQVSLITSDNPAEKLNAYYSSHFSGTSPAEYIVALCSKNVNFVDLTKLNSIYAPSIKTYYEELYMPAVKASLYRDYGNGFTEEDKEVGDLVWCKDYFAVTFEISTSNLRALRFDPCENFCRIKGLTIGEKLKFDFEPLNAFVHNQKETLFLNNDPIYIINIPDSNLEKLTLKISGSLEILSQNDLSHFFSEIIEQNRNSLREITK